MITRNPSYNSTIKADDTLNQETFYHKTKMKKRNIQLIPQNPFTPFTFHLED